MYSVVGYEDRMIDVYAAADLMVTRAGSSTIAELATTGMPAIVVPWAGAADDHQSDNARVLGDIGAAVVIAERDLTAPRLTEEVVRLAADREALGEIGSAAYAAGNDHRSGRLAELIDEVGNA